MYIELFSVIIGVLSLEGFVYFLLFDLSAAE